MAGDAARVTAAPPASASIDEVAIYATALTQTQVQQHSALR
jgi:hypothetical protein